MGNEPQCTPYPLDPRYVYAWGMLMGMLYTHSSGILAIKLTHMTREGRDV